jgi:hypothetical protein
MKKIICIFVFLMHFSSILVYCEETETVITGNDMAFSIDEYSEVIYEFFRNYGSGDLEFEIMEMVELNIYENNNLFVSLQIDNCFNYVRFTINRQEKRIMKVKWMHYQWIEKLNLVHIIMGNVPGIHLGNMPISIIDYDGDGFIDILLFTAVPEFGLVGVPEFGRFLMLRYDPVCYCDWLADYSPYFIINENSPQLSIVFTEKGGGYFADFIPYEFEANK